jgi:hypothetical protein
MLGNLWDKLFGGSRRKQAAERATLSPSERHFADESFEDIQADEFVDEHLGGISPGHLLGEDGPPPAQDAPPRD